MFPTVGDEAGSDLTAAWKRSAGGVTWFSNFKDIVASPPSKDVDYYDPIIPLRDLDTSSSLHVYGSY